MSKRNQAPRMDELNGDEPRLASSADLEAAGALTGRAYANSRKAKTPGKINLKMVADALAEEGMDPTLEIIKVLQRKVPVTDRAGNPVIDVMTGDPLMVDAIDPDTRLRTLNELLQYTQPKLKSVEMKVSGNLELSSEQLDSRLQGLLAKAQGAK